MVREVGDEERHGEADARGCARGDEMGKADAVGQAADAESSGERGRGDDPERLADDEPEHDAPRSIAAAERVARSPSLPRWTPALASAKSGTMRKLDQGCEARLERLDHVAAVDRTAPG